MEQNARVGANSRSPDQESPPPHFMEPECSSSLSS